MTKAPPSIKLKSLYVARFLLEAAGILLVIFAIFCTVLASAEPKSFHGENGFARTILSVTLLWLVGIGLLLPQQLAKLLSSLLLVGAGAWTFCIDAFRWDNLEIYCLFPIPLLAALWLRKGLSDLQLRRLPSAN